MDKITSCEFNTDATCVEAKHAGSSMISFDYTLLEAEVSRNMYESSELDWLLYNAPVDYVNLLLHGAAREYRKDNMTTQHWQSEYVKNLTRLREG